MSRTFPSLKRRNANRVPYKTFYIFSEGSNTEPTYFEMVKKTRRDGLVRLCTAKGSGDPLNIARNAISCVRSRNKSKNSFKKNDEVWAVFDRDDHEHWEAAISMCLNAGVKLGYSNPCFELWLILHYKDHDAPDDRYQIQRIANHVVPGYDHKGRKVADCSSLASFIQDAEIRAKKLCQRRVEEGLEKGPPSTSIWELTYSIRTWKSKK